MRWSWQLVPGIPSSERRGRAEAQTKPLFDGENLFRSDKPKQMVCCSSTSCQWLGEWPFFPEKQLTILMHCWASMLEIRMTRGRGMLMIYLTGEPSFPLEGLPWWRYSGLFKEVGVEVEEDWIGYEAFLKDGSEFIECLFVGKGDESQKCGGRANGGGFLSIHTIFGSRTVLVLSWLHPHQAGSRLFGLLLVSPDAKTPVSHDTKTLFLRGWTGKCVVGWQWSAHPGKHCRGWNTGKGLAAQES